MATKNKSEDKQATCSKECYFCIPPEETGHSSHYCKEARAKGYESLEFPLNYKGAFPGMPCERGYSEIELAEKQKTAKEKADTESANRSREMATRRHRQIMNQKSRRSS